MAPWAGVTTVFDAGGSGKLERKNAGRAWGAAGIARKWEGERRGTTTGLQASRGSVSGTDRITLQGLASVALLPSTHDLRFTIRAGKSTLQVFTRSNKNTATGPKIKIGTHAMIAGQRSAHAAPVGGVPAS